MKRARYLYQLQELENREEDIRERLAEIGAALGETVAQRKARRAVENAEKNVRRLTVQQNDLGLQANSLKQKISEEEQQLYSGSIRNPKELSEKQAEIVSLGHRRESVEEQLLDTMIELEEAKSLVERALARLKAVDAAWTADQQVLLAKKEELDARLADVAARKDALLPSIPAGDITMYRRLRAAKGKMAVALIRSGTCNGCWMDVPPARLARVYQDEFLFCENCERLLLLEEEL
ncbi:MAG: hypothetical protein JXD18_10220 [Anaerolineae bacterium]|nr:hypothetical protein [Anaerolineae bacterium]